MNEVELRYFYRLLRHGDMASRVHCQDPNKKGPGGVLSSTLVKGEDAVVAWAKQWNMKGQCYISRNPMLAWNKPGPFTCLTFDVDPVYDKAHGAKACEVQVAVQAGQRLVERFNGGYLATSGNGVLVTYSVPQDIQNALGAKLQPAYEALTKELKTWVECQGGVKLDVLADDARLVRLIGTWNVKGHKDNHRISRFLYLPHPNKARAHTIMAKLYSYAKGPQHRELTGKTYEPWVTTALAGLPEGQKHVTIIRLAGYFGGKHIPIEITKKLILEANTNAEDEPAAEEDVISRIEDVYRRIKDGSYASGGNTDSNVDETIGDRAFAIGTLGDSSEAYLKDLKARSNHTTPEISWPFPALNKLTWGIPRGAVVAMGAWTGKGKTSIALTVAEYLTSVGKRVLYFPTEMGQTEIKNRYISVATGIPNIDLVNGQVMNNPEQKKVFDSFYPEFLKRPFYMPKKDMPRLNLYELKKGLDDSKADIVIVDFLQRLGANAQNRRREVGEFIMNLKDEVKKRNIACIVLSQFHRPNKSSGGKYFPPTLFDFAECGDIENTADIAVILHPPLDDRGFVVELTNGERIQPVVCSVDKNRHAGKTGVVYLKVDVTTTKFIEA